MIACDCHATRESRHDGGEHQKPNRAGSEPPPLRTQENSEIAEIVACGACDYCVVQFLEECEGVAALVEIIRIQILGVRAGESLAVGYCARCRAVSVNAVGACA